MKIVKWLGICLLAVLVSAGFDSCKKDEEYTSRLRELILKDMTFEPNEDEGSLSRTSTFRNEDLTNYMAVSDASWCHVSINASESQMTVTVDENNSFDQRKAIVTVTDVKAPEVTRTFNVTQNQNNVIRVSETEYEVDMKAGSFDIEFEHNVNDYEVSSDVSWLRYTVNRTRGLSKSKISVSVKENDSGNKRTGHIYIDSESAYESICITVRQKYEVKTYFILPVEDFEIDERGGNVSVTAQTNMFDAKTGAISFHVYEPQEPWARLGEVELFTELLVVTQHVIVAPLTDKEPSRSTLMYIDDKTVTITQYRNLYIQETELSMLRQESKQLNLYNAESDNVKWSSSDKSVATVDENGLVTGVGVGTATITVKSSNGKHTDSITVTVEKPQDLRDDLNVEWQPYYDDNNEVSTLSCTLNNDSKYNLQLTKCEIYSDLKLLSNTEYNEKSGALPAGDSKKATFENLAGKGSKFGFTVVWYYIFNGESFTYRCEYKL